MRPGRFAIVGKLERIDGTSEREKA